MSEHDNTDETTPVEEIALDHPSAGDAADAEGERQGDSADGEEAAPETGSGAGEDYAGSGY